MSAIELRALRKRYPPREPGGAPQDLWRGLELTVGEGEFVAIEGQSGTGKSTLLHVVGGLDRAYEGEVLVLGERLRGLSDARLAALRHARIGHAACRAVRFRIAGRRPRAWVRAAARAARTRAISGRGAGSRRRPGSSFR